MGHSNRRLGERKHTPGFVQVEFGEPEVVGRFRKHLVPPTGRLLDISVTGALIEARTTDRVRVGSRVRLVIDAMEGTVVVRQIRPTALEGVSNYGVAFFELPHEMTQRVHEIVGRDRPDSRLQRVWDGTSG
ncbi:MAG: PilZ domain-containing protein [Microthrixaceae bacterium]